MRINVIWGGVILSLLGVFSALIFWVVWLLSIILKITPLEVKIPALSPSALVIRHERMLRNISVFPEESIRVAGVVSLFWTYFFGALALAFLWNMLF